MATLPILRPATYVTGTEVTTTAVGNVNDASDTTFVRSNVGNNLNGLWRYSLADTPADFVSMDTFTMKVRASLSATGNDTWTANLHLTDSSGVTLHTIPATQVVSGTAAATYTFTGAMPATNTKTVWDDAQIVVDFTNVKLQSPDGNFFKVYDIWVEGTYTTAGPPALSGTATTSVAFSLSSTGVRVEPPPVKSGTATTTVAFTTVVTGEGPPFAGTYQEAIEAPAATLFHDIDPDTLTSKPGTSSWGYTNVGATKGTADTPGTAISHSYALDGVDDRFQDNGSSDMPLYFFDNSITDFSFGMWVKVDTWTSGRQILGNVSAFNLTNEGFALKLGAAGDFELSWRLDGTRHAITASSSVVAGEWFLVMIRRDADTGAGSPNTKLDIVKNGTIENVLSNSDGAAGSLYWNGAGPFGVGAQYSITDSVWNLHSDIVVSPGFAWDGVITDANVEDIWTARNTLVSGINGTASASVAFSLSSTGVAVIPLNGTATTSVAFTQSTTGSVGLSGFVSETGTFSPSITGAGQRDGLVSATGAFSPSTTGAGQRAGLVDASTAFTGVATGLKETGGPVTAASTFSLTSSGSAVEAAAGDADTTVSFAAAVTGAALKAGTSSTTAVLTTQTQGFGGRVGAANEAAVFVGGTVGNKQGQGTATTAASHTTLASGSGTKSGTTAVSASFVVASTGFQTQNLSGDADTAVAFATSNTGSTARQGTATAGATFTTATTGAGETQASGSASASVSFAATVQGTAAKAGTVTQTSAFVAGVTGEGSKEGTAATSSVFTTSQLPGTPEKAGSTTASVSFVTTASGAIGLEEATGIASATVGFVTQTAGTGAKSSTVAAAVTLDVSSQGESAYFGTANTVVTYTTSSVGSGETSVTILAEEFSTTTRLLSAGGVTVTGGFTTTSLMEVLPMAVQTTYAALPDTELASVKYLRSVMAVALMVNGRVYTSVPANPTYPLVSLVRVGGTVRADATLDRATLQIECYGNSQYEANELSRKVIAALAGAAGWRGLGMTITTTDPVSGMLYLPDPETKQPRYVLDHDLYVRNA